MQEQVKKRLEVLERENQRLRRAVDELSILNDLAVQIGGARDLEEIMQQVVRRSLSAVGAEQGVITLVDEAAADPMKTLVRTMDESHQQEALRPNYSLLGWMHLHQQPLVINDPRIDERFRHTEWAPSIRDIVSVPMRARSHLVGILTLYNKRNGLGFHREDARLLSIIAAQSAQVVQHARLAAERGRILQVFGQHTSPAIVEELLGQGAEVTSRRQRVCVMFLDLRGFVSFAEQAAPEEVVAYLNRVFEFMIEAVNRHHGIIHQLLGDGFMALFGAPLSRGNDSLNAVKAALAIVERVEREQAAGDLPPTRIGIGLHAGEVVAGTVGSHIHKEYKVTGDVVNLAARIEQLSKQFDARLLVSETVWREAGAERLRAEPLGAIDVRGRAEPVRLFRLA